MSKLNKASLTMIASLFMVIGGLVANAGDSTSIGAPVAGLLAPSTSGSVSGFINPRTGQSWDGSEICKSFNNINVPLHGIGGWWTTRNNFNVCIRIKGNFYQSKISRTGWRSGNGGVGTQSYNAESTGWVNGTASLGSSGRSPSTGGTYRYFNNNALRIISAAATIRNHCLILGDMKTFRVYNIQGFSSLGSTDFSLF